MRITRLRNKDGTTIQLGRFVVLVGPNNAGKSRTLADINQIVQGNNSGNGVVIGLTLEKPARWEDAYANLQVTPASTTEPEPRLNVVGVGSNLQQEDNFGEREKEMRARFANSNDGNYMLGRAARMQLAYLNPDNRRGIVSSTTSINIHRERAAHPLHLLWKDRDAEAKFREAFQAAFGMELALDYSGLKTLELVIAKKIPAIPPDPRDAAPILEGVPRLDRQGDGFRSYAAVLLAVLVSKGKVILLDEPEAFLHPAQARGLGAWLAKHSKDAGNQIIVATHNANFLAGILSEPSEVQILRLNRTDDITQFIEVSTETTRQLSTSPLLSSQRVLEAVFARGVVVCEGDGDRAVYQAVSQRALGETEALFIHAQGKHSVHEVVAAVRRVGVSAVALCDFDLLRDGELFAKTLKSLGCDNSHLLKQRFAVATSIDAESDSLKLARLAISVQELATQLTANQHSLEGAQSALKRAGKSANAWADVKRAGLEALPEPVREECRTLLSALRAVGCFVVPKGELEAWIPTPVTKREWVPTALDEIAAGQYPQDLAQFVEGAVRKALS